MTTSKLIIIHTDRNTDRYVRYETVYVTESLNMDKIKELVNNWNTSEQRTYARIYDDPVLSAFVSDVASSMKLNRFILELKDCLDRLEDTADDIITECSSVTEFLKENNLEGIE